MNQKLFFDLETRGCPERLGYLPDPQAPAHYKDPDKIAAFVAEKRQAQIREAALDPDTGQIAAIGMRQYPDGVTMAHVVGDEALSEADALRALWIAAEHCRGHLVGYNILHFDLPFLLRRSMALGITPRRVPDLRRFQTSPITDLYGLLYHWQGGKGLKTVARLYGIPDPLPDHTGADVAAMDVATLKAHVINDVTLTVALFERMVDVYFPADDVFPF